MNKRVVWERDGRDRTSTITQCGSSSSGSRRAARPRSRDDSVTPGQRRRRQHRDGVREDGRGVFSGDERVGEYAARFGRWAIMGGRHRASATLAAGKLRDWGSQI